MKAAFLCCGWAITPALTIRSKNKEDLIKMCSTGLNWDVVSYLVDGSFRSIQTTELLLRSGPRNDGAGARAPLKPLGLLLFRQKVGKSLALMRFSAFRLFSRQAQNSLASLTQTVVLADRSKSLHLFPKISKAHCRAFVSRLESRNNSSYPHSHFQTQNCHPELVEGSELQNFQNSELGWFNPYQV